MSTDAEREQSVRSWARDHPATEGEDDVDLLLRLLDAERARAEEAEEFLDAALNAEAKQTARADAAEAKLAATQPTTMLHDVRCDSDLCAPECKIRQWCELRDLPYPGRK